MLNIILNVEIFMSKLL